MQYFINAYRTQLINALDLLVYVKQLFIQLNIMYVKFLSQYLIINTITCADLYTLNTFSPTRFYV